MEKNGLGQIFGIFNKLAPQQKIVLGIATGATLILMIVLFSLLNQPKYATLYSNLSQQDASKVVEQLNSQKVPYKIEGGGSVIQVPSDKVYEVRLQMASKGIPSSGVVGYEIFDKNTLGMSEFMQRLNFKRALEGELAKTIVEQDGIESARVHIVMPKKSVFKDEQEDPTASVVVKLRNGYSMDKSSVNAILNLVASSVEGLKQNHISLIDTRGQLLSKDYGDANDISISTSKQYELKQNIENYLSQKAQKILENVVGYGNSMVQVDVDLDFDQVEKTMELYDPESQVAISEQTIKSENSGINSVDSNAQSSQNTLTNYEINKTIQKVIQGTGNIKKLTVAAVVNEIPNKVTKDGVQQIVYKPRPQEQLDKLETIIKNSVGYNNQRKDNFSLVSIPFETNEMETVDQVPSGDAGFLDLKNMDQLINIGMVLIGIIASLLVLRSLMGKLKKEKILIGTLNPSNELAYSTNAGAGGQSQLSSGGGGSSRMVPPPAKKREMLPLGDLEDEISDEAALKKNQHDKITNYVSKNPVDAAKLINSWLHEEDMTV